MADPVSREYLYYEGNWRVDLAEYSDGRQSVVIGDDESGVGLHVPVPDFDKISHALDMALHRDEPSKAMCAHGVPLGHCCTHMQP